MPPRANWKGYLRLSLVSCPIALYPASEWGGPARPLARTLPEQPQVLPLHRARNLTHRE
jgi:hypothetical protein